MTKKEVTLQDAYWGRLEQNLIKHAGMILAYTGDVLSTIFIALLFVLRADLPIDIFAIIVLLALKPIIISLINVVFKGQTQDKDIAIALQNQQIDFLTRSEQFALNIAKLKQESEYIRELAQWQIMVAAKDGSPDRVLSYSKDWTDSNKIAVDLEELNGINGHTETESTPIEEKKEE